MIEDRAERPLTADKLLMQISIFGLVPKDHLTDKAIDLCEALRKEGLIQRVRKDPKIFKEERLYYRITRKGRDFLGELFNDEIETRSVRLKQFNNMIEKLILLEEIGE